MLCPHCGSNDVLFISTRIDGDYYFCIECSECFAYENNMEKVSVARLVSLSETSVIDFDLDGTTAKYSLGIAIKYPGYSPTGDGHNYIYHVHVDLQKGLFSEAEVVDFSKIMPKQTIGFQFLGWIKENYGEAFLQDYWNKVYDKVSA